MCENNNSKNSNQICENTTELSSLSPPLSYSPNISNVDILLSIKY